jgi:hypothetical protein
MHMKTIIAERVTRLKALGVRVNSTWMFQAEGPLTEESMREIAERDIRELLASELVICDATRASSSSGYHSEVGAAIAAGITLWVVGKREEITNVFFRCGRPVWFDTWEDAEAALLARAPRSATAISRETEWAV